MSVKFVSAGFDVKLEDARPSDRLVEPAAFGFGALIAPDDRGPQRLVVCVEQHGPVHLAGKADARDRVGTDAAVVHDAADRELAGAPPVVGILLGPGRTRRGERLMVGRCRRDDPAIVVDEHRARTARADVDAEDGHVSAVGLVVRDVAERTRHLESLAVLARQQLVRLLVVDEFLRLAVELQLTADAV